MNQTIVYSSRVVFGGASKSNDKLEWLGDIVEKAAIKNKSLDISGVLSYKEGRIIQLIEGEASKIQDLYAQICNDDRHESIAILLDLKNSQRIFSDWGMVLEPNIQSSSLFKEFLLTYFDDLVAMSAAQSDELSFFVDRIFN